MFHYGQRLDPDLLQAFVLVAELGSFTRAAQHLNRSQAAVSQQIKRLEERVGHALLLRSTASVELTATGQDFLGDARRLVAMHEAVLTRLNGKGVAGRVRLGVMEDYGTKRLPPLVADIAARFPDLDVDMEVGLTAPMLKRLGNDFEIVIAMHACGGPDGELVQIEQAVWAGSRKTLPIGRGAIPFALSTTDCLFRKWASEALDAAGSLLAPRPHQRQSCSGRGARLRRAGAHRDEG